MKTTTKDVINSIGYLLISYSDQIDQKKSVQKFKEIPPDKPKSKPSKGRGKPMVPQLHPQKGKRQAIVMTNAGKELQVWVLKETIKGYVVLNPDKKSEPPKGYLFGCVWTVIPDKFVKYL